MNATVRGWTSASTVASGALLAAAAVAGLAASQDIGAFLLGGLVLLALSAVALPLLLADLTSRMWRPAVVATMLIALSLPAYRSAWRLSDRFIFEWWALTHPDELTAAERREGVAKHWGGWGMAGNEGEIYLVFDPDDLLDRPGLLERWRQRRRLSCELIDARPSAALTP